MKTLASNGDSAAELDERRDGVAQSLQASMLFKALLTQS
jgi:hypothetical protein